jgi:uncharacterized membrane protein
MHCQNCRAALPQNTTYCPNCGALQITSPQAGAQSTQLPFPPPASAWASSNVPLQSRGESVALAFQEHTTGITHEEREERKEEEENERLMVFSDGIIAFALTVAAITIKIPASVEELHANGDSIILRCFMYIIAFIIVAGAWADHHTIFHHIKRNDVVLVILNFFYLASIVMFPIGLFFLEFGTELANANLDVADNQLALGIGVFLGSQIIGGLTLFSMWMYAKKGSRLLDSRLEPRFVSYMTRRLLSKPVTFVVVMIAAFFAFIAPFVALPLIVVILIAREIYFRRYRRGIDLSVGTDDTGRIQLFSDAVIGIAITLAVAQIEFPTLGADSKSALEAVDHQWPLLHAFMVGIVIMGVYWLFHYHLFRLMNRHDPWLVFLNSFFLLDIALMIVPVNWFVNYYNNPEMDAHFFFGFWQMLTSLVLAIMWLHACRKKRLLSPEATPEQIRRFGTIVIANPVVFLLLTILSGFVPSLQPSIYIGIYLVLIGAAWLFSQWNTKLRVAFPQM